MWLKNNILIFPVLILLCSFDQPKYLPSDIFPLLEGSEYTYRGNYRGKIDFSTYKVQAQLINDSVKVYYFIEKSDLEKEFAIIGSNMFGLGTYLFSEGNLWTINASWKRNLSSIDIGQKQKLLPSILVPGETCKITGTNSNPIYKITIDLPEDITVPAGTFKNCLKINMVIYWSSGEEYISNIWLAENVGLVRWQRDTGKVEELVNYKLNNK